MHTPPTLLPAHQSRLAAILGLALAAATCLPAAVDSAPQNPEGGKNPNIGVPYFLPKPILFVRTTPDLDDKGKVKAIKVDLDKQLVADRKHGFLLLSNHGLFTAATTTFEVEDGLLSAVNDTRENKFGDALQSIASFAFSLQTIPALKAQAGMLEFVPQVAGQAARASSPGRAMAAAKFTSSARPGNATAQLADATAFLTYVQNSPDYNARIKAFVATAKADEIDGLMTSAWNAIAQNGQPITFEQLMTGVDSETLKRSLAYPDVLGPPPTPQTNPPTSPAQLPITISLGDRLLLDVDLDFGDKATVPSSYAPEEAILDGPLYPGGAVQRLPNSTTRLTKTTAYRDRVLVRSERAVTITATLKPVQGKVKEIILTSLQADLKPLTGRISAATNPIADDTSWQDAVKELRAKAQTSSDAAEKLDAAYLSELQSLLGNEKDLSDGRGAFSVALLPVYSAAKTAQIARLAADAGEQIANAKVLGPTYPAFRRGLLTTLIKIYLAGKNELTFREDWAFLSQVTVATFPSPEAYQIPLQGFALGKATSGLKLSHGMLRSTTATRPAPAAEVAALPAKVIDPYIAMLKDLIAIKVTTVGQADDVIAQKIAIAKLEKEFADLQKTPVEDPAANAHTEAIASLTRTKELLDLQKAILELQEATKGADPVKQVQSAIEISQQLQQQISALQEEIKQLP